MPCLREKRHSIDLGSRQDSGIAGRVRWALKRPWSDGTTALVFSPEEFVERLVALIPPARANTIVYHGIFASQAKGRGQFLPRPSPSRRPRQQRHAGHWLPGHARQPHQQQPVGIATQQAHLRHRLVVEASAQRLSNYLRATVHLMQVLARACGHDRLSGFEHRDLTTLDRDIASLTGVAYGGVRPV